MNSPLHHESLPRWRSRAITLLIAATCIAAMASFVVVVAYLPLPVDGGWYSYPAYALSHAMNAYTNLHPPASPTDVHGIEAVFPWATAGSTRTLYAAGWIYSFGSSINSLRALSLLEYAALLFGFALVLRSYGADRNISVICVSLLALDKSIQFGALADFRPDIALGATSLFALAFLRSERTTVRVLLGGALCLLAATIHSTAPVFLSCVFSAAFLYWALERQSPRIALWQIAPIGLLAAVLFLLSNSIFSALLHRPATFRGEVDVVARILDSWNRGPAFLLRKELVRWRAHFLFSNLPQLAAVGAGAVLSGRLLIARATRAKGAVLLLPLAVSVGMLLILDPHSAEAHVVPLLPFLLLPATDPRAVEGRVRRAFYWSAAASALLSLALSARKVASARSTGFSNARLASELRSASNPNGLTVVAGGTELWPYFHERARVLILDRTRNPARFQAMNGIEMNRTDLVVIGADQIGYGWRTLADAWVNSGNARIAWRAGETVTIVAPSQSGSNHR